MSHSHINYYYGKLANTISALAMINKHSPRILYEVGISVKTIQEVSQHMMTELILLLDKNEVNLSKNKKSKLFPRWKSILITDFKNNADYDSQVIIIY